MFLLGAIYFKIISRENSCFIRPVNFYQNDGVLDNTRDLGRVLLCPQGNINPSEEIMQHWKNMVMR